MNAKHTALPLLAVVLGASFGCSSTTADRSASSEQSVTASQCATATPWQPWTPYSVGQLVTDGGGTYECIQGHTSEPGWNPAAVPALWQPVTCAGGGSSSSGSGSSGGGSSSSSGSGGSSGGGSGGSSSSGGGSSCDPSAWVYMGNDANACAGHLGESCGWTTNDEGQGYHCQTVSWGAGCEPGGATCPSGSGSGSSGG